VLRKQRKGTFKILAFVSVWVEVAILRLSVKKHAKSAFRVSVLAGSNRASALDPSRCVHIPRLEAVIAVYSVQPLPCRLCIIVCASTYVSADVTIDDTG